MHLKTVYMHNNPWAGIEREHIHADETGNSWGAVRNYLQSIVNEDDRTENDEVKLVLLGNSTAGKSSLMRYLRKRKYDPDTLPSTHGIYNKLWKPEGKGFKVNVWDFGGQEYYHATHRLFLSDNAVTLVVFEAEKNGHVWLDTEVSVYNEGKMETKTVPVEHFEYSYWIDSCRYFGKQESVICVVQTKMDSGARRVAVTSKPPEIPEELKFQVSVLGKSEGVNTKLIRSFDSFEEDLFTILEQTKSKTQVNKGWLRIKEGLRTLGESQNVITWEEYVAFCEGIVLGISQKIDGETESPLETLTNGLHKVGVILYFKDIPALKNKVFLNPTWVTDIIYKVLDYSVIKNKGVFDLAHVEGILVEEALSATDIIAMMTAFELIFEAQNGQYVAPQYLKDVNTADSISQMDQEEDCPETLFWLRYPDFMPSSVMPRFICRYGNLSRNHFWKSGICFRKNGVKVLVKAEKKKIQVRASKNEDIVLAAGLLINLYECSGEKSAIEVSLNGTDFVTYDKLQKHPKENPKIETVDGRNVDFEPFRKLILYRIEMREAMPELDNRKKEDAMHKVQDLVARARLKEALAELLIVAPESRKSDVQLLQSRLSTLDREIMLGIADNTDTRRNKITSAILDLVNLILSETKNEKPTTPPPTKSPVNRPKVFFSYAWGDDQETGESRQIIVDKMYDALTNDGFDVRRDNMNVEYAGLISEFMKELGAGDLVVVFMSDKYLKSVYCMWELCEIHRTSMAEKEKFVKRILPVRVEKLELDKPKILREYMTHWNEFYKEWSEMVLDFPQQVGKPQLESFEKSRKIKDEFGNVVGFFSDMNAQTKSLLSDNDFAVVKAAIMERVKR